MRRRKRAHGRYCKEKNMRYEGEKSREEKNVEEEEERRNKRKK